MLSWEKEKQLDNGVILKCFKVNRINVDMKTLKAEVSYSGHIEEDLAPVAHYSCEIDFSNFDPEGQLAAGVMEMVKEQQSGE